MVDAAGSSSPIKSSLRVLRESITNTKVFAVSL